MQHMTIFSMVLLESVEETVESQTKEFIGSEYVSHILSGFELHSRWYKRLAEAGVAMGDGSYQAVALQLRLRNHLWSSWLLLSRGYLVDSANALKLAFETLFLADCLRNDPAKARKWMEAGLRIRPHQVRELHRDGVDLAKMYGEICKVAHPNGVALRWNMDRHDVRGDRYLYGPVYDPELLYWILERLRPLLWASLALFRGSLPPSRLPTGDEDATLMRLVNVSEHRHFADRLREFKAKRGSPPPRTDEAPQVPRTST